MTEQLRKFSVTILSSLGFLCIISGMAMPHIIKLENSTVVKLEVTQKQVTNTKSNEIKLKDIKLEIGNSLNTDINYYLNNPNDIDESIKMRLKLNTSQVNINEIGNYTYTITYNKKIYNGSIIIVGKPLPSIDNITLNSLSYEMNKELSTNISTYIQENLPIEVISAIRLDLSNVNVSIPGNYLYSISYNGKLYTSTITIYEPKIINNDKNQKEN